jgi:hypothetical protein
VLIDLIVREEKNGPAGILLTSIKTLENENRADWMTFFNERVSLANEQAGLIIISGM